MQTKLRGMQCRFYTNRSTIWGYARIGRASFGSMFWSNRRKRWPYTMQLSSLWNVSPADLATTYIWQGIAWATLNANSGRAYIAYWWVLKKCYLFLRASVPWSSEAWTVKIVVNGTTEYTVSTNVVVNWTSNPIINTNLNIVLNTGDYICFKRESPNYATNPTVTFNGKIAIEPMPLGYSRYAYLLHASNTGLSPTASSTYAFADGIATTSITTARMYVPYSGIITAANLNVRCSTPASNEQFTYYVTVNGTTDYVITSTAKLDAVTNVFTNNNMSVPVSAGDYVTVKAVFPPRGTPPVATPYKISLTVTV